jgi:hypothetical protein
VRNGYLGTDGLLRFVSGEYAADNSHASMVGYVIKGTVNSIKNIIKKELVAQKDGLKLVNLVDNVAVNTDLEIDVSSHKRARNSNISISHIILDCC